MSDEYTFEGFEPANTTPVPDILFDELLTILSGAEIKVLLYIIRRTWGFKKQTDAISLSQLQKGIVTRDGKRLDSGCGIKRRDTICDCLVSLEQKGCIFSKKEKTSKKDNATTIYGIRFRAKQVVTKPDYPSHQTGLPVVSEADHRSPVSGLPVVTKPDPQETVLQDTDKQEDTYSENVASANSHAPTPLSLQDQLEAARQLLLAHGQYPQSAEQQPSSELSTSTEELSPESVDKYGQGVEETSAPLQASEQSYSRTTTQPTTPEPAQPPDTSGVPTSPSEKPARTARQRKPKVDMEPIAPPSKPDTALPFTAEKILAWGDYARQAKLSHSGRKDSKYQKAIEAARTIDGWKIPEDNFLLIYFNWMKGISLDLEQLGDDKLKSDTWSDFPVDLWVFAEHYQTEKGRYQKKKAEKVATVSPSKPLILDNASKQVITQVGATIEAVRVVNAEESDFVRKNREMAAKFNKKVG